MDPLPTPAQPAPSLSRQGAGCCGVGCLTLVVIAFLFLVVLIIGGWYVTNKAIDTLTSPEPADVAVEMPSDAEFAPANEKLNSLRGALRSKEARTFTFTAAELNAIIARHPDFASRKGKVHIEIADSLATVEASVPLESVTFSRAQHRWLNGSANFGFIYADEGFRFDINWVEANGHRFSSRLFRSGINSFNKSFSRGFEDSVEKESGSEFWRNVKTMTLDEDKLVVITRGSE